TYEPMTPKIMLDWMDAHEIDMAVPLPLESPESASYYIPTGDMLALCAEHPDRFIAFCVVDPRMSVARGRESFRSIIGSYVDQGAVGFGEVKVGIPMADPRLQAIYEACDDLRLPLVFHIDNVRCTDTPTLDGLEAMLRAYPNVKFIGHAPGFWSAISADVTKEDMGGYPNRPVVPGGRLDALFSAYDNLYADLSAGSTNTALTRDWEFGQGFLERNHQRLMFATDYLHPAQEVPQFDMFAAADLSADARAAIGSGNARRLLGV
ncbi:amidohydrolase family protein, partial [Candidatus Poribacteria bacterium]|nr:amidohydrolase family protein [Candidatus Poribacteria bacterium]